MSARLRQRRDEFQIDPGYAVHTGLQIIHKLFHNPSAVRELLVPFDQFTREFFPTDLRSFLPIETSKVAVPGLRCILKSGTDANMLPSATSKFRHGSKKLKKGS